MTERIPTFPGQTPSPLGHPGLLSTAWIMGILEFRAVGRGGLQSHEERFLASSPWCPHSLSAWNCSLSTLGELMGRDPLSCCQGLRTPQFGFAEVLLRCVLAILVSKSRHPGVMIERQPGMTGTGGRPRRGHTWTGGVFSISTVPSAGARLCRTKAR